jgi:LuxR family maltose regulon positive regulatory protein
MARTTSPGAAARDWLPAAGGVPPREPGLPARAALRASPRGAWRVAFVVAPWGWGTGALVARLARARGPRPVVVDAAEVPDDAVVAAVRGLPEGARLVVRARRAPEDALRAARAGGGVVTIGPERLALRPWEAARAFDPPLGALLPGADLTRLVALADGWPAVLRLAHESVVGEPAAVRRRVADALPEEVADVLRAEVVATLPADLREFLAATAPLPVLSAPACDTYLGTSDAAARLRAAAAYGLLLPVGDDGAVRLPRPLRACLTGRACPPGPPPDPDARWSEREEATAPPWLRRVARAVRETPAYAAPPASADPADELAAGVEALLAGRAAEALDLLRRNAAVPGPGPRPLAAELAAGVAAHLAGTPLPVPYDDLALAAARRGLPWLADLADAAAALTGEPARAAYVGDHAWRAGEGWVGAVCGLLGGLAAPRPDAVAGLDAGAAFFAAYGAEVAQAWCAALAAVAAGDAGRARAAAALARRTGCRGALAVALLPVDAAEARRVAGENGVDLAFATVARGGAPRVAVSCLGGLAASVDGVPVDLAALRPRARALLGLLAVHAGRPVHREVVAAALWPDVPGADAARRIHVAVSSVRRALGPGGRAVVRRGDGYALDAEVDVAAFDALTVAAHRLRGRPGERRALADLTACYAGDLLAEAGPAEWVVRERFLRRSVAADAGERLARVALAEGDAEAAVEAARAALRIDPYRDGLWQVLCAALGACGHAVALARARADHAALLAEAEG